MKGDQMGAPVADPSSSQTTDLKLDAVQMPSRAASATSAKKTFRRTRTAGGRRGTSGFGGGVLYRPRLVRHRIACYAARAASESWFCRTAAGVWNPCRSMSQVVL